jgi:hypothetical protein
VARQPGVIVDLRIGVAVPVRASQRQPQACVCDDQPPAAYRRVTPARRWAGVKEILNDV